MFLLQPGWINTAAWINNRTAFKTSAKVSASFVHLEAGLPRLQTPDSAVMSSHKFVLCRALLASAGIEVVLADRQAKLCLFLLSNSRAQECRVAFGTRKNIPLYCPPSKCKIPEKCYAGCKPFYVKGHRFRRGKHFIRTEHFGVLFCLPTPSCPAPKCPEIIISLPSSVPIFQPLTDFFGTQKRCLDNSQVVLHASQRNKREQEIFHSFWL